MSENEIPSTEEILERLMQFQQRFGTKVNELDRQAQEFFLLDPNQIKERLPELLEVLGERNLDEFLTAIKNVEEFKIAQYRGRDMRSFGLISSGAEEIDWVASKEELDLPDDFPEGDYKMRWCPKFLTGVITGQNPKNIATWRFHITHEPTFPKTPYIIVQYDTDWVHWGEHQR